MLRKHYIGFQHYTLWYPDTGQGNSNGSMWHIHKIGQGTHCDERGGMRDGTWRLIPVSVTLVTGADPPDWGKNIPINFVSAIFVVGRAAIPDTLMDSNELKCRSFEMGPWPCLELHGANSLMISCTIFSSIMVQYSCSNNFYSVILCFLIHVRWC